MNIVWTPWHASIAENEIADALAKEAVVEARDQPDCRRSTTIQEVNNAIKKTQLSKWQSRWDNSDHTIYMFPRLTQIKKFLDILNRKSFCQILQIQTGYSKLNEYRHKLGLCDSNEYICGEPETPEHFLIHYPNYQQEAVEANSKPRCTSGRALPDVSPLSENTTLIQHTISRYRRSNGGVGTVGVWD